MRRPCAPPTTWSHPTTVRVNLLRTGRDELAGMLRAQGCACEPGILAPEALRCRGLNSISSNGAFLQGLFQVQDEGAMAVAGSLELTGPMPVLDMCAAPGGKPRIARSSWATRAGS